MDNSLKEKAIALDKEGDAALLRCDYMAARKAYEAAYLVYLDWHTNRNKDVIIDFDEIDYVNVHFHELNEEQLCDIIYAQLKMMKAYKYTLSATKIRANLFLVTAETDFLIKITGNVSYFRYTLEASLQAIQFNYMRGLYDLAYQNCNDVVELIRKKDENQNIPLFRKYEFLFGKRKMECLLKKGFDEKDAGSIFYDSMNCAKLYLDSNPPVEEKKELLKDVSDFVDMYSKRLTFLGKSEEVERVAELARQMGLNS